MKQARFAGSRSLHRSKANDVGGSPASEVRPWRPRQGIRFVCSGVYSQHAMHDATAQGATRCNPQRTKGPCVLARMQSAAKLMQITVLLARRTFTDALASVTRHARTSLPASAGSRITADTFVCITGAKDTPGAQRLNAQSLATLASLDRAGHTRFSVIDSAGR